jgi:hypothetical protein
MQHFLWGAVATAALTSALFFLRFWRETRDRLLLFFALAFGLLGVHWILLVPYSAEVENRPYIYSVRLLAFVLIIVGIIDRNRRT